MLFFAATDASGQSSALVGHEDSLPARRLRSADLVTTTVFRHDSTNRPTRFYTQNKQHAYLVSVPELRPEDVSQQNIAKCASSSSDNPCNWHPASYGYVMHRHPRGQMCM